MTKTTALLQLFHLLEIQFYRRRSTEDRNRHAQPALVVVDFLDRAVEIVERTVDDPNHFAGLEQHLRLGLVYTFGHPVENHVGFLLADRRRLVLLAADEAHHLGHILDEVPGILVHFHLDQHVARKELALAPTLHALFHFDDFLGRNENFAKLLFHAGSLDTLFQRALNLLFEARIGVNDVPALCHYRSPPIPISQRTRPPKAVSMMNRMIATTTVTANTIRVVCTVSWRVGQTTLRRSTSTSRT